MTDTGQVPGEGQPESAGMVEQPGVPTHGAYTYLSEAPAEDEDLLLPGAQGAWGNEVPPPAPEPVVEAVHEPGPHETAGRDSGSVDLSGVRLPDSGPVSVTPSPILSAPHDPAAAPQPPRRPLHLGPPIPDASASPVRSLADRGPAGAPVRQPGAPAAGPEYLDVQPQMAPQSAAPWGAAPPAPAQADVQAPAAETVNPPMSAPAPAEQTDAAQAAVARLTGQVPGVHGHDGVQPVHAHDGVYTAPTGPGAEDAQAAVAEATPAEQAAPAAEGAPAADGAPTAPGAEEPAPAQVAEVPTPEAPVAEPAEPAEPVGEQSVPAEGVPSGPEQAVPAEPPAGPQPAEAAEAAGAQGTAESGPATEAPAPTAAAADAPQPTAPAEPAGATQAATVEHADATVQATDVAQPVEAPEAAAVEPAPVEPTAPTPEPAAAAPEAAAAEPAAPAQPAEAVEPVAVPQSAPAPAEPVAAAPEAAVAAQPAEAAQPVESAQPVDASQPAEVAQPVDASQPAEAVEPVDVPQSAPAPAEPVAAAPGAAVAAQPAEAPPSAESAQSVEASQPGEVAQPVDVSQPVVVEPVAVPPSAPAPAEPIASAPEAAVAAPEPTAPAPETTAPAHPTEAAQPAEVPPPAPAEPAAPAPQAVDAAQAVDAPQPQAPAESPQSAEPQALAQVAADAVEAQASVQVAVDAAQAQAAAAPEAPESAAPAVQVAEASAPVEPALLQAQGPQIAEGVPHVADAPAGSAVPGQQPQAGDAAGPAPVAGPQLQPQAPETPVDAVHAQNPEQPLPSSLPAEPDQQSLGQFVPVEGQVPTTPHLAPTPPHPLVVPAPREGEPAVVPDAAPTPDVVQHAEDLQTRAADQEESTAAVEEAPKSTGPAAPGYADAEREAVLKVMRERRDIRNGFRSDPIPHEVLLRVLEAAHTAPSVGHSQPWDFVVIRSADTRRTMHELAMRQREAYAKSLPKGRAKQFKELKIEAILDTPVNIVVTADPTRGGRHTLGRHTQPQMAPYSSALAVENLWLAARAEGLGVGWVSFFDEREMVRALGLPEHLEVVAYLCVGYVDEFPDEPELMQAGWSKRRPLSWVVHEETYGRRALPGEEPHDLLAETVAQIRPLDAKALGEAWERQKRMTKPAGALGMLEIISAQLSGLSRQCPPPIPEPAAVAIFAGDHGVHAQGVTPWPQEVTAQMVANFLGGGAVCNAFAGQVGAEVCVVDVGVAADLPATPGLLPRKIRGGTSDMTTGPAMTREEAKAAIEVGIETARDLVAAGNKALLTGEMGIANTTASAALISVFTGADPAEVTGRGTGINDETLARKTEVVRRALELHQPDPADPIGVLAAIGGFEHAAMVGLLLGGASLRTPVILDGVSAGAAALVARAIAPEVLAACIAGHRSAEPGHVAALNKLGLRPLVDLDLRLGEGTGALLALPLVQSAARAMHEVATFDSAGVTEK
ncbi:nicotinate-nucleotide--dimethylbenzimidazole phosphoribosyltransferase [Streptomyces sp. Go40/10]|uniref:nicotinate-nucleotide--dimethylbenzimidazole phosphoribosyltransferase n=1 Tax=Streptomyces sp. Go40/10 TaxID=2825844 RepID=UPI001E2B42CD|nr:nicotinate-nucleotide--dimethylbenzimidazole phosphoribosyltransferase [Streptomyces sp. Go40/10]UFR05603.1 nicotinate-nucleotide--dimethylbenzimidazole phosphoribosyltransferase [Streptomyces sp. Go40/10]